MARLNAPNHLAPIYTHEGAQAVHIPPFAQLRRAVGACMLWEDQFYESGKFIADRIAELCGLCIPEDIARLAIHARSNLNLRHVPLLLCAELLRQHPTFKSAATIALCIQRADEMGEMLAVYWRSGIGPLDHQLRKGLQLALPKFDEYGLAKYRKDNTRYNLRNVIRLARTKPKTEAQRELWGRAVKGELVTPDTWEVALSSGADKRETWIRLLAEGKLGYFALLRNLRNMDQVGVPIELVDNAVKARKNGAHRILPFRYIAAMRAAPQHAPALDIALCDSIKQMIEPSGTTFILVDVSSSMYHKLSAKSDMTCIDAAAGLAALWPGKCRVFSFSEELVECPPFRGLAGVQAVVNSQIHSGTRLSVALGQLNTFMYNNDLGSIKDRLIVITDEQCDSNVPSPIAKRAYMINVASFRNGVGYGDRWTHIDGFSEGVIRYIVEAEGEGPSAARAGGEDRL